MRNKVHVRREVVLTVIKIAAYPLTSKQLARFIGVKEVSVRAALTWLVLGGFIVKDGYELGYTVSKKSGRETRYKITKYIWTGKKLPVTSIVIKELPSEHDRECDCITAKMGDGGVALAALIMGWKKREVTA